MVVRFLLLMTTFTLAILILKLSFVKIILLHSVYILEESILGGGTLAMLTSSVAYRTWTPGPVE